MCKATRERSYLLTCSNRLQALVALAVYDLCCWPDKGWLQVRQTQDRHKMLLQALVWCEAFLFAAQAITYLEPLALSPTSMLLCVNKQVATRQRITLHVQ